MTRLTNLRRLILVCAVAAIGLAFSAENAFATHFRYATMTWSVPNPAQPNVVVLRMDSAWRRSYPWFSNGAQVQLGNTLNLGGVTVSGPGLTTKTLTVNATVTSINATADWLTATWTSDPITLPNTNSLFTATFDNCCRISTLADNNHDQEFIVSAGITVRPLPLALNQPPTTGSLPIVVLALNQPTTFQIPASDPNGDTVVFSVPPAGIGTGGSGLSTTKPAGLTLSPSGVVTWTPTAVGLYAMQVKVTDPLGAYTVADFIMQVQTATGQPPSVLIDGTAGPKTYAAVRNTPIAPITISATDPENSTVMLTASGVPLGATLTPALPVTAVNPSTTFNWTPTSIGTFVISFAGLDGDGNQVSNSATVTVGDNPPTLTCNISGSTVEATGPGGFLYSVQAVVDDPEHDPVTLKFFYDGVLAGTAGPFTPPTTQTNNAQLGVGAHTYQVTASDGLSTVDCNGPINVVDTTAPTILVAPGDQTITAVSPAGAPASFTVTASDVVDPSPVVSCSAHSGDTFPIGTTTVSCTATDASGNHNDTSFTIHVSDPTPPVVTPTISGTLGNDGWYKSDVTVSWTTSDPESGILSTNGCTTQTVTADTAGVTFTCSATNNDGVASAPVSVTVKRDATVPDISFAPATISAEATSATGAAVTFALPTVGDALSGIAGAATCDHVSGAVFALGATAVSCSVSDNAGNSASAVLSIVVADHTAPSIGAFTSVTVEATTLGGTMPVTFATPTATDAVDPSPAVVCSPVSGSAFSLGATTVTCTATDASGNSSHSSGTITVQDTTAPSMSALSNISLPGTGVSGASATWTTGATDVVDGAVPVVCSPASGSTFGYGTTPVSCTATDAHGNIAHASFTVEVTDSTPPAITPTVTGTLSGSGWYTSNVSVSWSVTDAQSAIASKTGCDATTITADGAGIALTCSATSAGGTSSQTVTFNRDATAPSILAANVTAPAAGLTGTVVAYPLPTAADALSGLATPVTCSPAAGSLFPIGSTPVTCHATDVAGNTGTAVFTVSVADTAPPVITAANITVSTTGPNGIPVLIPATAVDAVSGMVPVTCTPGSGAVFPVGTTTVNCSATDGSGNTATKSITVTVTPPASACFIVDFREVTYFKSNRVITSSDATIRSHNGITGAFDPSLWPYRASGGSQYTTSRGTLFRLYGFAPAQLGQRVYNADNPAISYAVQNDTTIAGGAYYVDLGGPARVTVCPEQLNSYVLAGVPGNGHQAGSQQLPTAQRNVPGVMLTHNTQIVKLPLHIKRDMDQAGIAHTDSGLIDYIGFQQQGEGNSQYREFVNVQVSFPWDSETDDHQHYTFGFHTALNTNFESYAGCNYLDSDPGNDGARLHDLWGPNLGADASAQHSWPACGSREPRQNQAVRENYDVPSNAVQLLSTVNSSTDTTRIFFGTIRPVTTSIWNRQDTRHDWNDWDNNDRFRELADWLHLGRFW